MISRKNQTMTNRMIIVYFWKIIIERKLVKKDLDTKNELPIVLQKTFFLRFEIKMDLIFVKLRRKKVS